MRKQTVPTAGIDHAAAAKETSDPPRGFPRLEQLFARQAGGATHRATEPVKQGVVWKAAKVVIGQASA